MGKCNFCDFDSSSYEYFDKESVEDRSKTKYGIERVYKEGIKVLPCLHFSKTSEGKYYLAGMIEEDSGDMTGTYMEINYCTMCGRKLE